MTNVEALLARLYADESLRGEFLADPRGVARREGLGELDAARLESIDRDGLVLASRSFARKRASRPKRGWWARLRSLRILPGIRRTS